jgi:hypothetical protein
MIAFSCLPSTVSFNGDKGFRIVKPPIDVLQAGPEALTVWQRAVMPFRQKNKDSTAPSIEGGTD